MSELLPAVGYVRVSTTEQARDGVSLEVQTSKIRQYCELYGLRLICVLSDGGESGKNLDRPALTEALDLLDQGKAGTLVVAKLDRLTRSVKDLGTLLERYFDERAGKHLCSVADAIDTRTAAGRLVLNVLMSVAQWERETIVERTRNALDHKRSKGERVGGTPYGWFVGEDGRTLVKCPTEQGVIEIMQHFRSFGNSYAAVAERLNRLGYPTKRGGEWRAETIRQVLRRVAR